MQPTSDDVHDDITDVPGVQVGHAEHVDAKTGVTVILPTANGIPAGLYIGGHAFSTREMDSLKPEHSVSRIHGVCLSGGSTFGLDAVGGVTAYLEERKIGLSVLGHTIPIVPAAVIFDLNFGTGQVRPDKDMGKRACENATAGPIRQGSVGAGIGATVGILLGVDHAMKGGLGSASVVSENLVVGALVVVNALGDIVDQEGNIVAGARRSAASLEFADASKLLAEGKIVSPGISIANTTLAVVAVNADVDKISASKIAAQATLGLGRVIRPFHSNVDGDLTMVLGLGGNQADSNRIALLASEALQRATIKAVRHADGFGILPAWKDLPGAAAT
jgi:L-aminopeptidase/D-esterase-like protein